MALDEASMARLAAWGPPKILLVPNDFHRLDARIVKDRFPDLRVLCPAAARKKVEQVVAVDGTYADFPPIPTSSSITSTASASAKACSR